MKTTFIALALFFLGLCSCNSQNVKSSKASSTPGSGLGVNVSNVQKYVTCSTSKINSLLAHGDAAFANTAQYTLDLIDFDDDDLNNDLLRAHQDTIPVIVSIYDTYYKIIGNGESQVININAYFIWHEVAKMQLTRFLQKGGHKVTEADFEKVFCVIDHIAETYSYGPQMMMNRAAARQELVEEYCLLDAYTRLMDQYPSNDVKQLVHKDFLYVLNTCQAYIKSRYEMEWYSMLPLEMSGLFCETLRAKAASLNGLLASGASKQVVIQNLTKHNCLRNGKTYRLTQATLSQLVEEWSM